MPPKADPYATPAHRRIDALLLVISAIVIAILLLAPSHSHANGAASPRKPSPQIAHQ